MGAGRPPQPAALKVLKGRGEGKDSAGRPIPSAPKFDRGAPEPPEWLSDVAREEWEHTAPELDRLDLLKPADLTTFATYCETWATYVAAIRSVRANGITLVNPESGRAHKNPDLAAAETAGAQLLRFATEFGLTPAAEQKVARAAEGDGESDDPFTGHGDSQAS